MFEEVYKYHGLPKNIISDRDVLFTSTIWKHLHKLIGTSLKMSSAYHPQTDGATERANRTVTQMLRQCIHPDQKDWVSKLPAIQFAINSAQSASTGFSPFFLNYGRAPRSLIWNSAPQTEYAGVRNFALQQKLALMAAHDSIIAARVKQTRDSNRKRQITPFQVNDLVYLSTQNISFRKGLARKLVPKFIGPYKILEDYNNSSFKLELPPDLLKRGVHSVFHSSLLRVHVPNDDRLFPGRLESQLGNGPEAEEEWAVDEILSHHGTREDILFEIKWKAGDVTWLSYHQISHLQALKSYLDAHGVEEAGQLPPGKGNPPVTESNFSVNSIELDLGLFGQSENLFKPDNFSNLSSFPSPSNPISTTIHTLLNSIHLDVDMGKRPGTQPVIQHPKFFRHSRYIIIIKVGRGTQEMIHVSQIHEAVKYSDFLLEQGIGDVSKPVPLGYSELAEIWNSHSTNRRYFATIKAASVPGNQPTIHIEGLPITMRDFHITPDDCGLGTNQTDLEMMAITRHVAMNAIYGRQQQSIRQQQRKSNRYIGFGDSTSNATTSATTGRKRRRRDDNHSDDITPGGSQTTPNFSNVNNSYQSNHIDVEEDSHMKDTEIPLLGDGQNSGTILTSADVIDFSFLDEENPSIEHTN
jgi:hypothetical protein